MFDTVLRAPVPASTRFTRVVRRSLSWLGALYALGCSSQVTPDYAGEPMAVLRGALAADGDFEMPAEGDGMTVGLVWLVGSPDGQKQPLLAEVAQTEGEFPFGFRLSLFSPPTREAQSYECLDKSNVPCLDRQVSPVYQGLIAVLDERADLAHLRQLDILGASLEYGVFYFERDGKADDFNDVVTLMASVYNVPPVRGYHLYAIGKDPELYAASRRCSYNGLCVQSKVSHDPEKQYWADHAFEECLELVPDAATCTEFSQICPPGAVNASECTSYFAERGSEPTPAEIAQNERCAALSLEHQPSEACGTLESPWRFPGNPLGFDATISIELGAGLFEFMN